MTSPATSDRPVDARADRYVEEAARLHPVLATFAGVAGHDDRLPDLSPDGFAAREELDRRVLADVRDSSPVDARGRVSARRQLGEIAGQVRRWTGEQGTGGDTFRNLVGSLDAEGALADSLQRHAAEASAAVADFGTFLSDELGPRGREREAIGRD